MLICCEMELKDLGQNQYSSFLSQKNFEESYLPSLKQVTATPYQL